jgi:hypothetical protein
MSEISVPIPVRLIDEKLARDLINRLADVLADVRDE